jgi:pyruvate kinase
MAESIDIGQLTAQLQSIYDDAIELESHYADDLAAVDPAFRDGALNLVHYLALHHTDISDLQKSLADLGLSSLDRVQHNVLISIRAVLAALASMSPGTGSDSPRELSTLEAVHAENATNQQAIFGDSPADRDAAIMVTLPSEAGSNTSLVSEMFTAGMNVARINCARDSEKIWADMVDNVRKAAEETGSDCKIVMDLAGPKIRTGDLRPGPRVFHIKPRRDPMGRAIAPRRIRLIPDDVVWRGTKVSIIPVPRECIEYAHEGDQIRFKDTRGKKRKLDVILKDEKGLVVETLKGAYLASGTKLRLKRDAEGETLTYRVSELPSVEQPILLRPGDTLVLHKESVPGAPAVEDSLGDITEPAHISCRQPEVFEYVAAGERISLNDGKIAGIVETASEDQLDIEIRKAKPTGSRLRSDRGINFPDSDIRLPGLTAADRDNLEFMVANADAISLSFVKRAADVVMLQDAIDEYPDSHPGIIVKIETKKGFKNLPKLLLTAMRRHPAAVMIARGDLAVECGWERLAELQEEILLLCQVAHMPVIWATQVLESETKKGQPSRAEISDAALAQRADCVMLNKGPHILTAISLLDTILRRMQSKKRGRIQ